MNEQDQNRTALKKWAETTVASLRSWWIQNWWLYLTFLWVSSALATAVPFGLALLLYVEEPTRTIINLITLACSGLSSVLFMVTHVARLKERANVHRDL